tara:strand:+ start:1352 stop:1840 length:489 start_codon:yes stop_codon:yes gene_type:complete
MDLNITGVNDDFFRYKMEGIIIRKKTNKTFIKNLKQISKQLNRDIKFIQNYFNKELSIPVRWIEKESELEISGKFKVCTLQDILQEMINNYITCKHCNNPETNILLRSDKKRLKLDCIACGLGTKIILKNSGNKDVSSKKVNSYRVVDNEKIYIGIVKLLNK